MLQNPYTHGTIRWARVHLANSPEGCQVKKDCPDCAYAGREVEAAFRADVRVLTLNTQREDTEPPETEPKPRRVL